MSKATLEFDLADDRDEFLLAFNGGKYWSALWDFRSQLRSMVKHGDFKTPDGALEAVEEAFREATAEINWDEIS